MTVTLQKVSLGGPHHHLLVADSIASAAGEKPSTRFGLVYKKQKLNNWQHKYQHKGCSLACRKILTVASQKDRVLLPEYPRKSHVEAITQASSVVCPINCDGQAVNPSARMKSLPRLDWKGQSHCQRFWCKTFGGSQLLFKACAREGLHSIQ